MNGALWKMRVKLRPTQIVFLGFTVVILIGALLLMLPISSKGAEWTDPLTALFTSTSATCVTGLVVVDTYTYWSGFGQGIILLLIQLGGLGFMSFATMFSLILGRKIGMSERLIMMESLNLTDMAGVVRTTKRILFGTVFFEAAGAVILAIRFSKDFGLWGGIQKGIFHSVSAFCNAGFDLMSEAGTPFTSMTAYRDDLVVNLVLMALIVIGGLGFLVWDDVYSLKTLTFKKLSPYSKLVITISTIFIVAGAVAFYVFEYNNPATLGMLGPTEKILPSFFQSVTSRTAGFNTIDQTGLYPESKLVTIMLMFVGGSSGSTAGGIKTVTFAVLILMAIAVAKGKRKVVIYERTIPMDYILRALTIFVIAFTMVLMGVMILLATQSIDPLNALFECVSAFGTVGLSAGITPTLSALPRLYMIVLMYFGRLGILTVTLSIASRLSGNTEAVNYPTTKMLIG